MDTFTVRFCKLVLHFVFKNRFSVGGLALAIGAFNVNYAAQEIISEGYVKASIALTIFCQLLGILLIYVAVNFGFEFGESIILVILLNITQYFLIASMMLLQLITYVQMPWFPKTNRNTRNANASAPPPYDQC